MFRYECPKCDKFKTQTKPQIVKHLMEEHDVLEEDINNLVKSKLRLQDISTFIFFYYCSNAAKQTMAEADIVKSVADQKINDQKNLLMS